ncbi:hypothetical protein HYY69_02505 [Candidatus Woesearchaeota archaeon]|nr:hypothetical protein [Candidatus Woesearchaeota archaeon]
MVYYEASKQTVFGDVIGFLDRLGVYDIVLPFLLVFTIVFAIFEKTKVLGTEEVAGKMHPKKNLNAMAAFVIAFLVIASARLVAIINESLANIVLLLLIIVMFLLLIGAFHGEGEDVVLKGAWRTTFMVVLLIGILLIFLNAIPMDSGESFLGWLINYVYYNLDSTAVGAILFFILILLGFGYIVKSPKEKKHGDDDKKH